MAKAKREKKSFESKVRDLDEHFVEEVLALTPEQLGNKLIGLTKYQIELQDEKENDEDLQSLKEQVAEAGKVYSEGFKAIKMKQKYIFNLLTNQGALDSVGSDKNVQKAIKNLKKSLGDDSSISITVSDGQTTSEVTL